MFKRMLSDMRIDKLYVVLLTFTILLESTNGQMMSVSSMLSADPECTGYTTAECALRKEKCKPINTLMQGTGGPVKPIIDCATAVGIPKTNIFSILPQAFSEGKPESIVDKATPDPNLGYMLRRCILSTNGLIGPDDSINRMVLASQVQAKLAWNPPLAQIILDSFSICPDPINLQYTSFLACLRQICISNVPMASFAFSKEVAGSGKDKDKKKCKGKKCKKD